MVKPILDIWKFYDVTHKHHVVCNPMSTVKIDELIELLKLDPNNKEAFEVMGRAFYLKEFQKYKKSDSIEPG